MSLILQGFESRNFQPSGRRQRTGCSAVILVQGSPSGLIDTMLPAYGRLNTSTTLSVSPSEPTTESFGFTRSTALGTSLVKIKEPAGRQVPRQPSTWLFCLTLPNT